MDGERGSLRSPRLRVPWRARGSPHLPNRGIQIALRSPARDGSARRKQSRRSVFTWSPARLGISEGAMISHG